jgi:hypothetical protein
VDNQPENRIQQENKDVINFYINSGFKGFQTKYFTEYEQQEVVTTKSENSSCSIVARSHVAM